MTSAYLDVLDQLLGQRAPPLTNGLARVQVAHVTDRQLPDGGFPGRRGAADLYYTDFALRILALLDPHSPAAGRTAAYISALAPRRKDVVECFCLLNCVRSLGHCGVTIATDTRPIATTMRAQALPDGGFARAGGADISAYNTFMASLCHQLLGEEFPNAAGASAAISGLQRPSGGYAEQPGEQIAQTNATAAATAFLVMTGAQTAAQMQGAAGFLASMQADDGGLLAHEQAPQSDLLSTFTGLLSLVGLDGLDQIDVPAMARFVRSVANPNGGFRACPGDDAGDIEYTYYGIGCLAILRAIAAAGRDATDS